MATVYRKTYTKPLPPDAELLSRKGERIARWKDNKGRFRTAKVTTGLDGSARIIVEAGTFTAKYRDGDGVVREVSTGCKTKDGAFSVLKDLTDRAERVRSGILTSSEDTIADHQPTPLSEHIGAYVADLTNKGVTAGRIADTESRLNRVAEDCGFRKLGDLSPDKLDGWLSDRLAENMSAATHNGYLEAFIAFGYWCIGKRTKNGRARFTGEKRLTANPFAGMPKADQKADPRRKRRALTEPELVSLLDVAQRRPLLEAMTVRRGKRKGQAVAKLRPETRERLEQLGRERALIYKSLVLTGLRRGELDSLTTGQLELDAPTPYAVLNAADEKNREGSDVPLRADLAKDLQGWLAEKLERLRRDAIAAAEPVPMRLPPDTKVFNVPTGLVRILDRDLRLAGIPKRDERRRTIDVHALRHTFGTHLSKGGVPLRTAQAAMRHSDPSLTANVYTDPKLLDVAGALDALPSLPLEGDHGPERQRATGTAGTPENQAAALAPMLAPKTGKPCKSLATAGKEPTTKTGNQTKGAIAVSVAADKRKHPADKGCQRGGATGRCRTRTCDPLGVNEVL